MECKCCNYEFERFEYFVVGHKDNGEEVFMCESCFFDFALKKLNCKSVKMDYNRTNYYDPTVFDDDF